MYDIITIGDCTVDTFIVIDHDEATLQCDLRQEHCQLCLNYADKIPIKKTHQSIGGNAANVAIGCKQLDLKVSILTELGDDLNGLSINQELKDQKIDPGLIKILPKKESRYSVVLNYLGERTVLSHHVDRNYSFPKLPESSWLYYTSLGKSFEKIQTKLIKYLKKNPGIKLAMNPGSYQLKKHLPKVREILCYVDVLFVNKEEAAKLIEAEKNTKETAKDLHKKGVKITVITDGTHGTHVSDGKQIYFMPIYPIKAVDKTGAGDAFASGFISALINNKSIEESMEWGTANASGVIQKIGAEEGLLNKQQINKVIKKFPKIKPQII